MDRIFKYVIEIVDRQKIKIPNNARLRHVGLDPKGIPCIWVQVELNEPPKEIELFVIGTGNLIPERAKYHQGSFVDGPFVWHIFTSEEEL